MTIDKSELLKQYIEGKKALRKKLKALDDKNARDKEDIRIINSMIREMDFNIEWIETGVYPGEPDRTIIIAASTGDSYWDESIGVFAATSNYIDPFIEVEERIDKERRRKAVVEY